jgi:HSP20 family protein
MLRISHDPLVNFLFSSTAGTAGWNLFARSALVDAKRRAQTQAPRRVARKAKMLRNAKGWELRADLPGIDPDAVELEVGEHDVSLSFDLPLSAPEGMSAVFIERPAGRFERKWKVRETIDADDVAVEYTDGFLTVHLKPRQLDGPRKIKLPNGSEN